MEKLLKTKNHCFHYREFGMENKKTILCLPGYADSSRMFTQLGHSLKGVFHIVALDLPLFYEPETIQCVDALAWYVGEFVEAYPLPKFTLAGFSFGGLVAIAYASAHPQHVTSLYLLSSSPQLLFGLECGIYKTIKPFLLKKSFCRLWSHLRINPLTRPLFPVPISEERQRIMRDCPVAVFGTQFNILDTSLTNEFSALSMPKTIVVCEDDRVLPWKRYQTLLRSLHSRIVLLKQGGHGETEVYWKGVGSLLHSS